MFLHLPRRPRKGFLRTKIGYPTLQQQRVPTTGHARRFAEGSADTMRRTEDFLLNRYLPERRRPVEFFLPLELTPASASRRACDFSCVCRSAHSCITCRPNPRLPSTANASTSSALSIPLSASPLLSCHLLLAVSGYDYAVIRSHPQPVSVSVSVSVSANGTGRRAARKALLSAKATAKPACPFMPPLPRPRPRQSVTA